MTQEQMFAYNVRMNLKETAELLKPHQVTVLKVRTVMAVLGMSSIGDTHKLLCKMEAKGLARRNFINKARGEWQIL